MAVYIIRMGKNGPVKIGHSSNLASRMRQFKHAWPYLPHLVAVLEGGAAYEKQLHARFRSHSMGGEWFKPARVILDTANWMQDLASNDLRKLLIRWRVSRKKHRTRRISRQRAERLKHDRIKLLTTAQLDRLPSTVIGRVSEMAERINSGNGSIHDLLASLTRSQWDTVVSWSENAHVGTVYFRQKAKARANSKIVRIH